MWTEEPIHIKPQPTHTLQSRLGHSAWPCCLPTLPQPTEGTIFICRASLTFRKYLCIETMDPGTAQGRWKESWSEGGWQCLPGSIPFTTDYAEQGHGGRWFWDRSMSKERQRSWERVWSRTFMISNWGSWGYVAWRKRRFKGDLISLYNSLKGVCSKTGANLLSRVTGQEEMAWGCARRSLDWIAWKISSQKGGYQALEQAAQASVESPSLNVFNDMWMWNVGMV